MEVLKLSKVSKASEATKMQKLLTHCFNQHQEQVYCKRQLVSCLKNIPIKRNQKYWIDLPDTQYRHFDPSELVMHHGLSELNVVQSL